MSDSKKNEDENKKKRNLPSWMASQENPISNSNATDFSKLMKGVVFVLSGFVNPERSTLRSHAIEMGAQYRPDWSSDCTLLVCAYPNTPKFRQVEADCGTIVEKEWILQCHSKKKLVDIDAYLMHAGKPWRKCNDSSGKVSSECGSSHADKKASPPRKSEKQDTRGKNTKSVSSSSLKGRACETATKYFSPSKVKKWATDDLNRTISWLESQEEKPEPSEIKYVAAEGIIICLQDFIDSLEQNQDVRKIIEQWNIIPHAVEELIKLLDSVNDSTPISNKDLCRHAKVCKQIYEAELRDSNDDSKTKNKKLEADETRKGSNKDTNVTTGSNSADYDSDETIEMTEEEIDLAYNNVVLASKTLSN